MTDKVGNEMVLETVRQKRKLFETKIKMKKSGRRQCLLVKLE